MKTLRCGFLGLCLAFGSVQAAVVRVVDGSTGKLTGATGVVVGSMLYDVEFLDGTCASVFLVCDVAHFTFRSDDAAGLASEALLHQILLDVGTDFFDSDPTTSRGCENPGRCESLTPYRFALDDPEVVLGIKALNAATDADQVDRSGARQDDDLSSDPSVVWARWSPHRQDVSEPGALALLAVGFVALISAPRWRIQTRVQRRQRDCAFIQTNGTLVDDALEIAEQTEV
jgi:hypothetical protein